MSSGRVRIDDEQCMGAVVSPPVGDSPQRNRTSGEGRSMQGLIDLVRKGWFPAGSKLLCAHLGGVPAINARSYIYRNG